MTSLFTATIFYISINIHTVIKLSITPTSTDGLLFYMGSVSPFFSVSLICSFSLCLSNYLSIYSLLISLFRLIQIQETIY